MDVINFGSKVRVEWSCPECKNKNEIGLPALFYAIQRRYMVECAACGDSFYVSTSASDRAAELPLEPASGTCPSCGMKYAVTVDGVNVCNCNVGEVTGHV